MKSPERKNFLCALVDEKVASLEEKNVEVCHERQNFFEK
jgi:hypothetical protein